MSILSLKSIDKSDIMLSTIMKNFLRIFTILTRKQMMVCVFIIFLMFICASMEAFGIGLVYPLIQIIGNPNFLEEHVAVAEFVQKFGVVNHRRLIFFSSICLLFFYIFKNIIVLYEAKLQIAFSMNNQKEYTSRLYAYYMSKPYLYHVNTNLAVISRNIGTACSSVFCMILVSALSIITELVTVFVIWVFLAVMDLITALGVAFIIAPFILLLLNFFRKKIGVCGLAQAECAARMSKWINQGFVSLKETKVMQREKFFSDAFSSTYTEYVDSLKEFQFIQRVPKSIIELVSIGGMLLLIAIKMLLKGNPDSLIASLGVLALAAVRLMPSLNRTVSLFNDIKFNMPFLNEIYDDLIVIKRGRDVAERGALNVASARMPFEKEISVQGLSFAYPSKIQKDVLKDVSFSIPKGAFIGIIGPSGAGKTTFVDILLGLLPPKNGAIYVDGQDIYKNTCGWLSNIAYVPQSIYLIDGTIRDNIAFGHTEDQIDDTKVEKVLHMAELYDFVQTLPDGVRTEVGDRGSKLSGGQKQRIGIARALYNEPSVLVLDEATSALDNETEKQITDTILNLKGKITIISIAHRLSTLENCDFKIKFENGKAERITQN